MKPQSNFFIVLFLSFCTTHFKNREISTPFASLNWPDRRVGFDEFLVFISYVPAAGGISSTLKYNIDKGFLKLSTVLLHLLYWFLFIGVSYLIAGQ